MEKPEGAPLPDAISASGGHADTAMDKSPAPDVPEEIGAEEQEAEGKGESPKQSPPSPTKKRLLPSDSCFHVSHR